MSNTAAAADAVAEAYTALRARSDIQFDLPPPPEIAPPPPLPPIPMMQVVFWLAVAVGVVFLIYLIVNKLADRKPREAAEETAEREVAKWRPEEKVARALLADADAMAAAGRFDEAARLLLHRSLEDIAKRKPKLLRPALTSREIALAPMLPDAVRDAFASMAAPVERSLFGGRVLDRAAWEGARAAYNDFALPKAWS